MAESRHGPGHLRQHCCLEVYLWLHVGDKVVMQQAVRPRANREVCRREYSVSLLCRYSQPSSTGQDPPSSDGSSRPVPAEDEPQADPHNVTGSSSEGQHPSGVEQHEGSDEPSHAFAQQEHESEPAGAGDGGAEPAKRIDGAPIMDLFNEALGVGSRQQASGAGPSPDELAQQRRQQSQQHAAEQVAQQVKQRQAAPLSLPAQQSDEQDSAHPSEKGKERPEAQQQKQQLAGRKADAMGAGKKPAAKEQEGGVGGLAAQAAKVAGAALGPGGP